MKGYAAIAAILIIIIGCQANSNGDTSNKNAFIGGTKGVSMEFDNFVKEVYDGGENSFAFVVKLQNDGEYPVLKEKSQVTISGILASEFGVREADLIKAPTDNLEAIRKDPDGTVIKSNPVYVEFDNLNHNALLAGNTQFTVRADICYKYGTTANSKICIRKNNLDVKEGVCKVNEDKAVFSSGAPIQITTFKENGRATDKVSFTFTIAHKGTGLIFQQDSNCNTASRSFDNRIWVDVSTKMDGLECTMLKDGGPTSGYITLYGTEMPITCTQKVSTASDYETPVVIKLTYDYKDSKQETLLVKHVIS